ncbi:glycosyltransferase [Roseivivax sediminis]|uniref:UDP-N-acetylglucosamine transferase subunit ALG13 n=1 Tax=Roseivivax sediminis TaxID=936889 RepID=A0A1I2DDV7_9RHOB|nr:glycosyltransferase [Roseivivax sediminis]SFE78649.1 UDP-N-acetylglucosamine transferase subunit ALG13 [Roseivivax sediminis]
MIFVTVGTQLPFPRLIEAVDRYAAEFGEPVVAQVGQDHEPRQHIETHDMIPPQRFDELFRSARVIVAHAGIGTILSAKKYLRPLVVMPRRHDLGEHRNDHQLATVRHLGNVTGIHVAQDCADLFALLSQPCLTPPSDTLGQSHIALLDTLSDFLRTAGPAAAASLGPPAEVAPNPNEE